MSGLLENNAFGWIEEPWSYQNQQISIRPVENFPQWVGHVTYTGISSDDWIYPPIVQRMDQNVAGPTVRFMLPSTHYLSIDPALDRPEMADFLILSLGFLLGLNLKPAGLGHLHRTARRMGYLVNFVPVGQDLEYAVNRVIRFFHMHEHHPDILSLATAALHWYLTSQSYHHSFEMFTFQYSVLDCVHKLSETLHSQYRGLEQKGHSQRPVRLSSFYRIPIPPPFGDPSVATPNAIGLAATRNELVHEARWLGQPLGYTADSRSWEMLMHLRHFNSQLILGVLGIECEFRSHLYSGQTQGLDVTVTGNDQ